MFVLEKQQKRNDFFPLPMDGRGYSGHGQKSKPCLTYTDNKKGWNSICKKGKKISSARARL